MPKLHPTERVRLLEERLGTTFARPELALAALTHKTYVHEHPNEDLHDNQRLEFLGDAVVNLAIAHRVFERFPRSDEGELSRLRARIVDEKGLARVARQLGLGELLLLGRGEERHGGQEKDSLLADALEAIIAAVYLGAGMEAALVVVDRLFAEVLNEVSLSLVRDFKSRLQELAQESLKQTPRYQVVAESGPDHEKTFEVEVLLGPDVYARASGRSKKEAEQVAARTALDLLSRGEKPSPGPQDDTPA